MKKKLKLGELKVKSFVTSLEDEEKNQIGGIHPTIPAGVTIYITVMITEGLEHLYSIDQCCHHSMEQKACDAHTKHFCSKLHCHND